MAACVWVSEWRTAFSSNGATEAREETRGGGGDIGEDDQEEEGEVLPEGVEDRKGRNEDEDLMGDIEDAANPEELEEMLGRPDE